jgi:hypothetical protein
MRLSAKMFIFFILFVAACAAISPAAAAEPDKRWVHFSYERSKAGTDYYYDSESVTFLSNNRVSVWLKRTSSKGQEVMHTEIECSGSMFRTIQPYKPLFRKTDKTSYSEYGWLEIPPDSEIHQLRMILCTTKR